MKATRMTGSTTLTLSRGPLEAAVFLDAITSATDVPEKFEFHPIAGGGDPPLGARAVQMMPDLFPSPFMDAFGRSMRKALPAGPPSAKLVRGVGYAGRTNLQPAKSPRREEGWSDC